VTETIAQKGTAPPPGDDLNTSTPKTMVASMAYASASAASAGLLLALFILSGRMLGEADFGKFSFALLLGTVFETVMDFGLHQVTIREVARDRSRARDLLHHTLGLKLLWTLAGLLAIVVAATVLRKEWDVRIACYLIGGSTVARSFTFTIRGVLQGLERFGWDSIVVLIDRLMLLLCGAIALLAGTGLRGLTIAFVLARAGALVLAAWLTHAQLGGVGFRFTRTVLADLQRSALPLGFFLIVLNLYSYIDGVMLGVVRGDAETGVYSAAYKVYEGLSYLPSVIASVLTPRLSSLYPVDRIAHRRLALGGIGGSAALAVFVGAVSYLLAGPLLVLLFGAPFLPSAAPFRILSLGLPFVFAIWVLHATAISVNKERLLLKAAIVGLVVNLGTNAYAIPHLGANGAALATVVGEFVSMLVLIAGLVA
jgi:O-antigen/teichoic acid export membrane protein